MNHGDKILGHLYMGISWMFAIIQPSVIPIILSSLASLMAIVSYYFQIKKNRKV